MKRTIISLIIFSILTVHSGYGLDCYSCQQELYHDEDCPFPDKLEKYKVSCDHKALRLVLPKEIAPKKQSGNSTYEDTDKDKNTADPNDFHCVKLVYKDSIKQQEFTSRACITKGGCELLSQVLQSTSSREVVNCVECQTNYCNL